MSTSPKNKDDKTSVDNVIRSVVVINGTVEGGITNDASNAKTTLSTIDLSLLAQQLTTLRDAMKENAQDAAHYKALSDIAQAAEAAHAKNEKSVIDHLKSAGSWALEIASKIGVSVAAEALKKALGM